MALISLRGGYGSNYLLDESLNAELVQRAEMRDRIQRPHVAADLSCGSGCGWTSIYGPMVGAGLDSGRRRTRRDMTKRVF